MLHSKVEMHHKISRDGERKLVIGTDLQPTSKETSVRDCQQRGGFQKTQESVLWQSQLWTSTAD